MNTPLKLPLYAKLSLIILGTYVFVDIMYVGQAIILPLIYAGIMAILLNPLVQFLEKRKWNRILAITLVMIVAILLTFLLVYFISSQLSLFGETFPKLKVKFDEFMNLAVNWVSHKFNISVHKIEEWIAKTRSQFMNGDGAVIGRTVTTIGGIIAVFILIPVYIFMILYYQPLLLEFIRKLFGRTNQSEVADVLLQTKKVIQSYLTGLLIEAAIVACLNSAGLLILGIRYAFLLGIIGAILNVIPYLGGIVAVAMPMAIALVTKSSPSYSLLVLAVYLLIQFIDNHHLIPKIVASKVRINALISVIVVLIGGAVWGIPGMFLSIPLTAIFKIVFDHIEPLKPWGFLLGDTMPSSTRFLFWLKKK